MPSSDELGLLILLGGVLLLASPAAILTADVGEPSYRYEAVELGYENGSFVLPPDFVGRFSIENIACTDRTRSCHLERHVHDQGRLAVEDTRRDRAPYEYVHLDDGMFRVEAVTENGTAYLTHESVDPETAIRRSSSSYDAAPPAFRAAVDRGSATSDTEWPTPRIVSTNPDEPTEQFYYVWATSTPPGAVYGPDLGDRLLSYGLSLAGFTAGLFLVLRGHRIRLRERWF